MTRGEKIAFSLLKPINPTIIIVLGIYTIAWGLWIANPFWTVFTQAPLYSAMASVPNVEFAEVFWGLAAVVFGIITTYGALKPSYRNLQRGAFMAFFHWLIISVFYFMGDWTSTGGITCVTFAFYAALIWVNVKVNKEHFAGN